MQEVLACGGGGGYLTTLMGYFSEGVMTTISGNGFDRELVYFSFYYFEDVKCYRRERVYRGGYSPRYKNKGTKCWRPSFDAGFE